jgi:chromosome segregation ATPase
MRSLDYSPQAVAAAVRGEESPIAIQSLPPTPVHAHVGLVASDCSFQSRTVLAAVGRSRGLSAPQDDAIASLADRIADLDDCDSVSDVESESPATSLRDARRRVADASGAEDSLRERCAALRGRVQALREVDGDPTAAKDELLAATRRLSEVETERIAAEQVLDGARATATTVRDQREKRLRLEDRKANLERDARRHLASDVHEAFAAAVDVVPGSGRVGSEPGSFEGDSVTAMLAAARVAALDAPVVVACERFESADTAAACLDAPVLYV